jgi:hypothetical protein
LTLTILNGLNEFKSTIFWQSPDARRQKSVLFNLKNCFLPVPVKKLFIFNIYKTGKKIIFEHGKKKQSNKYGQRESKQQNPAIAKQQHNQP